MSFWSGFYKAAGILPKIGITSGLFSRGGVRQAAQHNPLPSAGMKPMSAAKAPVMPKPTSMPKVVGMPKRVGGQGAGGMPIP